MIKKRNLITIVFIFIALFFFGFWFFFIRDEPPVDDSALYVSFQPAPEENNGYFRLIEAGKRIRLKNSEVEDLLSKQPFDTTAARRLVDLYSKELVEFYQGLKYPNFGPPNITESSLIAGMLPLLKLAHLQGKLALGEGKSQAAADIGVFLIRLGFQYEHCNGTIVDWYFGMNMKRRGLDLIWEAFEKGLTPSGIEGVRTQLPPSEDSHEGYIQSLRVEYSWGRDIIADPVGWAKKVSTNDDVDRLALSKKIQDIFFQIAIRLPIFYKTNKTIRIYHNYFQEIIAFQRGERRTPPKALDIHPSIFSGNLFGEYLLSLMTPSLNTRLPIDTERQFQKIMQALRRRE